MQSSNLITILKERSVQEDKGITFIEGNKQETFLSFKALYHSALKTLAFFQQQGIRQKDELVFQVEDNHAFVIAFWACILGGIIPVPLTPGKNDDHRRKLFNIWPILNNPYLLISQKDVTKLGKGFSREYEEVPISSHRIIDVEAIHTALSDGEIVDAKADDIAFIQFSSGSTGSPKGVILTHKSLITNMKAISKAAGYTSSDSTINWMPLTHDMGLIGFHLNPLFIGMNQYLMPVSLFIRRPAIWLDKASEHKVNILCSPNFGYEYVIKHCQQAAADNWDLSHVRLVYNGAEPVSENLCRRFLERLSASGLRSNVMCPVYGLAEATLAVSISRLEDEVISLQVNRQRLNTGDKILLQQNGDQVVSFVNLGKAVDDCAIRIADDGDHIVEEEIVGHIQIKGDGVTSGYYNNAATTRQIITTDGWLKTGDLGFISGGALYVTGRAKDIIFINGQNYYPPDIESVAEEVEGIELNKIAVAGLFNEADQKEEVVAFVVYKDDLEAFLPIVASLKRLINQKMGLDISSVIPVKHMPRTTSGKLQRFRLAEQLRNGEFEATELALNQLIRDKTSGQTAAVLPENEEEQRLLEIWKSVLKNEAIGVTHSFFETGGNSLKAAEMSRKVLKVFQAELPLGTIYEKHTVRELAREIASLQTQSYIAIPAAGQQAGYPLSTAQRRLYYLWNADRDAIAYNIPVAIEIKGKIDKEKLESGIRQLISRHELLRASFHRPDNPVLNIATEVAFTLYEQAINSDALPHYLQHAVQPFDLENAPLFRAGLLKVESARQILFLDFHHIIADGVSIYTFLEELFALYNGHGLPELFVQYKDYSCWESTDLQSAKMKLQEAFWLQQLSQDLPVLEMPLDFLRPAVFNTAGGKLSFQLDQNTVSALKTVAQLNNCTMHVLLFTIYHLLLSKYTGQEDIVIGIPVAGRRHPDLQHIVGMFVNNLVITNTTKSGESFAQLLARINSNIREALNNAGYPFSDLVQKIKTKRDISRNPLFDTMFIYQNMGFPVVENPDFSISRFSFDPGFSKFDISLEVFDDGDTIEYSVEYAASLFTESTIRNLAKHFEQLISGIISQPAAKMEALSVMDHHEYEAYITTYNATRADYPYHTAIHRLFELQVERTPDATAIEYNGRKITYRELNDKANNLAAGLQKKWNVRNDIVGILLQRSPELIIAILGVLKAGGCYLPIDPDLPEARVDFLVTDSRCNVVIAARNTLYKIGTHHPFAGAIINMDEYDLVTPDAPQTADQDAHLAYVIYTSGTTGNPKGVKITHRSLVNYIWWAAQYYVRGKRTDFPLYTAVSFDLTVTSVFTPLITGNTIVIYEQGENELLIEKIITDNKVDIIKLTPSHLKILEKLSSLTITPENRITRFIVGGEALTYDLANSIYNKFGGNIAIYNEYGPTEATVGCMIWQFNPEQQLPVVPIGVPVSNTQVYILDKALQPVPQGVNGEIYISGDGVAEGYLFNEPLTSEKFIPDPFSGKQQMYKTGDVAKRLPDGTISYVGRFDQQVKINGYRIELTEIAHHLNGYPGIEEALVTVRRNRFDQQYLCAYYKNGGGDSDTGADKLKAFLAKSLPYYMIPAYFIPIDKIWLTQNGKVDYDRLPEPGTKETERVVVLPQNNIEASLWKIWKEVLEAEELSVTDNFFESGGDSIKATQIVARLFAQGISLRVKDILTYHTITGVAPHAQTGISAHVYEQGIVKGEKLLTPVEWWFFKQHFETPGYYNQSVLLRLKKPVHTVLLEAAFKRMIAQHDGLRLNYDPGKKRLYYNETHIDSDFIVDVYEKHAAGDSDFNFIDICERTKQQFDLESSLLLKAVIIREDKTDPGMLLITAHHLLVDGVSWRILLEDLYLVYHALEQGANVPAIRKTASLADWQRALMASATTNQRTIEERYWRQVEETYFDIPQDVETNDWRSKHLQIASAKLNVEDTARLLKEVYQVYKTEMPVILNTALALTLQAWTGLNKFLIEQENHGRHLESIDVSGTTGWFTVLYPLLLELTDDTLVNQLLGIKEQVHKVPDNGIGYGIYRHLKHIDSGDTVKRTAIRLNYLGQFGKELNNDLFAYEPAYTGREMDPGNHLTAKLELDLMIISGELQLSLKYNKEAHTATTIGWFVDTFFHHINRILTHAKEDRGVYLTSSDFDTAALDQEELDTLFQ
jgi:amino acid adenylation domain-containing protein/non-ribosomal peptide synthase protein (TIGR01720 family)